MRNYSLNQLPLYTDDIFLRHFNNIKVKDAIVIWNPSDAMIVTPVLPRSKKTLEEHIAYIQSNNIKKAIVAAEDIAFLQQCTGLEYLMVYPALSAENFDYSPLYEMPNIKWLQCKTMYGLKAMYNVKETVKVSDLDYSRFPNLKVLIIDGEKGHQNVQAAGTVETLAFVSDYPGSRNLSGFVPGESLVSFSIANSPIQTLDGIETASKLRRLELSCNRKLTDISALRHLRHSLAYLEIDSCGKISDFSVLSELQALECLILKGTNTLADLSFLKDLPKLKNLTFEMNVSDGDLSLCEHIPYVSIKNRKHYSHKDSDLPKGYIDLDKVFPFYSL